MDILVLGDSHIDVFRYCNGKQTRIIFDLCIVPGATAQGAVNPNSKTNAFNFFTDKLEKRCKSMCKPSKVIICLGEVDCGFLIWVRSKRNNICVDEQIKVCVDNLFKFIKEQILGYGYDEDDIIVTGVVLPTIRDCTDKGFLNGARKDVDVSQLKRTKKTLEYNSILESRCREYGYKYMDITNETIGMDGTIQEKFLSKNKYDHHLDNESTFDIWMSKLNDMLYLK